MPCFKYAGCFTPKEGIYQKAYKLTGNLRCKWNADKIRIFQVHTRNLFPYALYQLPPSTPSKKTPKKAHQKAYPLHLSSNKTLKPPKAFWLTRLAQHFALLRMTEWVTLSKQPLLGWPSFFPVFPFSFIHILVFSFQRSE